MEARAYNWIDGAEREPCPLVLGGMTWLADPSGALFHEEERALLVADLHLEKGSSFARRGMMLPPYDTRATLAVLGDTIRRYAPRLVIALGDSFHDGWGAERLPTEDRRTLLRLQMGRDWIWLAGNHDPVPHAAVPGMTADALRFGTVMLRHEPTDGMLAEGEIAGHLHPVARVLSSAGATRRRCFLSDGMRCIMPAFGSYAGGLNIRHRAFAGLWPALPGIVHVLGRDRIFPVASANCVGDA